MSQARKDEYFSKDGYLEISFFINPLEKDIVMAELKKMGITSISDGKYFPKGMISEAWVNKVNIADTQLCVNCNHYKQSHQVGSGPLVNEVASDVCWGLRSDNNACKCKKFIAKP